MTHPDGRSPTRWIRPVSPRHPTPAVRLVCVPYAGAGASVYQGWRLPAELATEVWAFQPPGREGRHREPLATTLESLLDGYLEGLAQVADRPFALFGHSLGALVAFELARRLRRTGGPRPAHLFLSGYRAPHRPPTREPISTLPDDRFLARMWEIAGPSPSAIRDPDLLLQLAPVTRTDCAILERYRYEPEEPLDIPFSCFAADDDCEVAVADVAAWAEHTTRGCWHRRYQGGHLFPRDHARQLQAEIATDLVLAAALHGSGRLG